MESHPVVHSNWDATSEPYAPPFSPRKRAEFMDARRTNPRGDHPATLSYASVSAGSAVISTWQSQ